MCAIVYQKCPKYLTIYLDSLPNQTKKIVMLEESPYWASVVRWKVHNFCLLTANGHKNHSEKWAPMKYCIHCAIMYCVVR